MTKRLRELHSASTALSVLGTDTEIADMFDIRAGAVNNWRNQGWLPAKVAFRLQSELNQRGYFASPKVLGQIGCEKLRLSKVSQ